MLSIGRIGAADAGTYYLDRQAGCELDYYTGAGESRGCWLGGGAAALGLSGELDGQDEAALRALLAGHGPEGERLVGPVLRGDVRQRLPAEPLLAALTPEVIDCLGVTLGRAVATASARVAAGQSATVDVEVARQVAEIAAVDPVAVYRAADGSDRYGAALAHAGAQVDVRRAGLDVTVSAPKSVSVLYGLGDPRVAAAAKAAHQTAVGEVVAYLQRHGATAARGHHGGGKTATRIGTEGLIVASFDHRTSRAGDPQLHTHLVIPNVVRATDGRWSAMDTAAIYRHARTASSVYHAVLRGELTSRLGVSWTPVTRGVAEIDGIPPTLLRLFSQRRQQIVETMRRRGTSGVKAAHAACLDTRPAKRHDLPGAIRDRWAAAATVVGFSPPQLGDVIGRARTRGPVDQDLLAAQLFGPEGVTADKTTFTRQDLAKAICEGLPAGMPIRLAALDQLVAALIRHPEVVAVASRDGCERRYTTRELLLTEQAALATATTPAARPVGIGSPAHYALELDLAGLSDEQAAMVGCLTGSGRRVDVVAGPAGAGKTAGLAAAYRIWVAAGLPVQGAAVSWLAAQQLEATTGITSSSLATTLHHADRNGLPTGVILVLDEASLVNTRTLDRLQRHVVAADGKLVVVGDPHQLPEIGAGGLFAALAARPEAIQLTGNQRQQAAWERDALRQLRDGDPVRALAAYTTHHRVHTEPDSESLSARIAVDYVKHIDAGADVLVLAARRSDVSRLNHAIRGRLIDSGRLGAEELSINTDHGIRGYRVGDRVIVTVNDRHRGLVNGSRGAISSLDPSNTRVRIDLDDGHHATIDGDSLAAGALAHGYAATVHKAQGLTVDITLVCGLGPLTREHGYVALSRGRTANHLYVASDVRSAIDCGPPRPTARQAERALTAELVERLRESRSQRLASLARPDDRWSEPDRYADDHDRSRGRSR